MRLTHQTDYGLRMLMQLAVNPDSLVTISEVSDRYNISKNHLMKVAQILVQEGVVESVRGRNGGLKLARPAQDVNVGTITRAMESSSILVECFPGGRGMCLISPACRLKGILANALEAFYAVLDEVTLFDLVTSNESLKGLLGMERT